MGSRLKTKIGISIKRTKSSIDIICMYIPHKNYITRL